MSQPPLPKLLVSDDQPEMVAAWGRRGRQLGFEVLTDTESRVVELARQHQPALILLDVNQTVNGLELLHVLKRDPRTRDIPVMVVSASDDPFIKEVCAEFGAVEFVPKPIAESVIHRLAEFARLRREDPTAPLPPPIADA